MSKAHEPNKDYIISSLRNTIGNQAVAIAEREAVIEQLAKENEELKNKKL